MSTAYAGQKLRLSLRQIINMSVGFFGIQFAFGLQNASVSRIFQTLGADINDIPILWIAAPITGLIIQPIIGHWSDKTWHRRWGRRRPFLGWGCIGCAGFICISQRFRVDVGGHYAMVVRCVN